MRLPTEPPDAQITLEAFDASAFRVVSGIHEGDPLGTADAGQAGDQFALDAHAEVERLLAPADPSGVAGASADVMALAEHRLMNDNGQDLRVILLQTAEGRRLIWPDRPISPDMRFTLITSSESAQIRALGALTAAFAAGTTVLCSDGRSLPVEELRGGERLLTRDHGPQVLRWIGCHSLEARDDSAPVLIQAGSLGNLGDLLVAPRHRIFVFPHSGEHPFAGVTGGRHGILIEAHHLVNDETIQRHPGGNFDFFALVFDNHEVIYAEGLPCESHIVTEASLRRMPDDMAEELKDRFPGLSHRPHYATGQN